MVFSKFSMLSIIKILVINVPVYGFYYKNSSVTLSPVYQGYIVDITVLSAGGYCSVCWQVPFNLLASTVQSAEWYLLRC